MAKRLPRFSGGKKRLKDLRTILNGNGIQWKETDKGWVAVIGNYGIEIPVEHLNDLGCEVNIETGATNNWAKIPSWGGIEIPHTWVH